MGVLYLLFLASLKILMGFTLTLLISSFVLFVILREKGLLRVSHF